MVRNHVQDKSSHVSRGAVGAMLAAVAVTAVVAIVVVAMRTGSGRDATPDLVATPAPVATLQPGSSAQGRVDFSAVLRPEAPVACSPHEASLGYGDVVAGRDVTAAAAAMLREYRYDGIDVVSFAYGDQSAADEPWFLDREVYLVATAEPNHAADYRVSISGGETIEGYRYQASRADGGRLQPDEQCAHTEIGWEPDATSPVYLVVEGAPPGVDRATVDAARGSADGVETWIYIGDWLLGAVA